MLERKDILDPERVKLEESERAWMDAMVSKFKKEILKERIEKDLLEQIKKL